MHTVIVFPGGRQVDALLLAASAERLRVVIPGRGDTAEFQLIEGRWTSESGGHVELGAILAADSAGAERVLANTFARAIGGLTQSSSKGASFRYLAIGFSGSTAFGQERIRCMPAKGAASRISNKR